MPALWRDATTIQLGDDVVIDRVDAPTLTWLRSLDGLRTAQQVARELPIDVTQARRLLRALLAAGAIDDAACTPASARWAGREHRDALAAHMDALVAVHHDSHLAATLVERRQRHRVAILGTGTLRDEVAAALDAAGVQEVATVEKAHVIVLANAHHPDVPAHFDHDAMDLPHLHVGAFGERATVGPFVVPGVTSCLRCAHLHRRDADPAWPLLAVQWSQAIVAMGGPLVDPLLARAAGVQAAILVRARSDAPEHPDRWAGRAVDLRLPELLPTTQSRPPHPLCGCLWTAP